MITTSLGHTPM